MRVIITATKKDLSPNSYAATVLLLLKEIAKKNSSEIIESSSFIFKRKKIPEDFFYFIIKENSSALKKIFDETQLSFLIKKTNADIVINFQSSYFKSLKLPQLLVFTGNNIFRKNITANNFVLVSSEDEKKNLSEKNVFKKENIRLIYPSANSSYQRATDAEKNLCKEKNTEGKEFFYSFFNDDENELINILKAFSVFKKWQRSNMKLILKCFSTAKESFQKKLSSYKYRDDVQLIANTDENSNIELLKAAYAFLYAKADNANSQMLVNALQCCIPVITFESEHIKDICANAAVYTVNNTAAETGKQMVLLYKDEILRKKMAESAVMQAAKFSIKTNAKMLWDFMNLVAEQQAKKTSIEYS